jgi:hypothetical protein
MAKSEYKESLEFNKTKDKVYLIPCSRCLIETHHKVLSSADVSGKLLPENYLYWEEYQIVQCQGCDAISFRKNSKNSEDLDYFELADGSVDSTLVDHIEIYPSRIAGRSKVKRYWLLPAQVEKVYDETHSALSNKLMILGAIGIRVLVESVCKTKEAVGVNLKAQIDDLVQKGVLTQDGADILHTLRALGNESAHEMKSQDEDSIDLAMDVVENLLQSVFILAEAAKRKKQEDELSL